MSVPMSNGPTGETADARGDLATWLDDFTAGRCGRAQMQASFLEICRSNPEAPWDALALLDQYQRRGRVDVSVARTLKSDIAQLVFGVVNNSEADDEDDEDEADEEDAVPAPEGPTTDPVASSPESTGARWRKLAQQRGTSLPQSERPFVDPVQFAREAGPQTRPATSLQDTHRETPAAGKVLRERYELLTVLGRGAAGTVYKALDRHRAHLDLPSQYVAVRVFALNYRENPGALGELERQFHQAQSLSHPNIVRMFDLDRDGPTYFLVMEFLEGELLSDVLERLDRHPMPRRQSLSIIASIGAALAYAHRRGVVHSDLRPGNVMLASDGEVKLLDIGFTHREPAQTYRAEPWIGDAPPGSRQPDLAYASEERVAGQGAGNGEDVYSLACIAYQLLSGRHPYDGRSAPLARAHGRPPKRIPGLNNQQWSALRTGLKWSYADRRIGIAKLVASLGCIEEAQQLVPPHMIVAAPASRRLGAVGKAVLLLLLLGGAVALYWSNRDLMPQFSIRQPVAIDRDSADGAPATAATPTTEAAASEDSTMDASVPEQSMPTAAAPSRVETAQSVVPQVPDQAPKAVPHPAAVADSVVAKPDRSPAGISRLSFDRDTYTADESDGSVRVIIRRSGSTRNAATFRWSLLPNSAEAANDYAAIGPGTETIPAGERSVAVTIPLVSDALKENTELFLMQLSDPDAGSELGEISRAAIIIVDDD